MRDRTAVAIIIAIWLLSTILWLQPGITRPDGVGYYVYLPSAYIGHDLLFFDEWRRFGLVPGGRILHKEITMTDHLGDHWTCGSAVWWLPTTYHGKPCYRVFWGRFATREEAVKAAAEIPDALHGSSPVVVKIPR